MPIDSRKFKEFREEARLSQTALARAAKVSQQLISQIENGVNLTTRALPQIARALNRQVSEINPDFEAEAADAPGLGAAEVPLVSWISAGRLTKADIADEMIGTTAAVGLDPKGDWIAFRVEGDSMDRISPPESIIFVNRRDKRLVSNALYVVADEDGSATYKRFRPNPDRFEPVSANKDLEPLFPSEGNMPLIVGRVRRTMLDM